MQFSRERHITCTSHSIHETENHHDTGLLTKVRRIYNQYISGSISVTKMNQVSPENLIKDILFEGISTAADPAVLTTDPLREHVRYEPNFA